MNVSRCFSVVVKVQMPLSTLHSSTSLKYRAKLLSESTELLLQNRFQSQTWGQMGPSGQKLVAFRLLVKLVYKAKYEIQQFNNFNIYQYTSRQSCIIVQRVIKGLTALEIKRLNSPIIPSSTFNNYLQYLNHIVQIACRYKAGRALKQDKWKISILLCHSLLAVSSVSGCEVGLLQY